MEGTEQPQIVLAVLADRAIIEQDGTISLIRIIDRLSYAPGEGQTMVRDDGIESVAEGMAFLSDLTLVLGLQAKRHDQAHIVEVVLISPSGYQTTLVTNPAEVSVSPNTLRGNFVMRVNLALREFGMYGFQISINGEPRTVVPLYAQRLDGDQQMLPQSDQDVELPALEPTLGSDTEPDS